MQCSQKMLVNDYIYETTIPYLITYCGRSVHFDNQDDFVSDDGSIEHNSLDELIWGLGMNLPSWDDQDNEFKNKDNDE